MEKATKKNFDITLEEVLPTHSVSKDNFSEPFATTTTNNNTITTKFGTDSTFQMDKKNMSKITADPSDLNLTIDESDYIPSNNQFEKKLMKAESNLIDKFNFNKTFKESNLNKSPNDYTPSQKNCIEVGIQENAATIEEGTDPHLFNEQNDASTQKDFDDIVESAPTITGKELLETLRRELQYEELIDLEMRKRQRLFYDSELLRDDIILERVDEENDTIEATESVKTSDYTTEGNFKLDEQDFVETSEPQISNECQGVTSENNKLEQHVQKEFEVAKQEDLKMAMPKVFFITKKFLFL